MPETLDKATAKWIEWLEVLRRELMEIYVDKLMFAELYEKIRTSGATSGIWLNHYLRLYVSKQTMAVRRITRGKPGTISLTRLFGEMLSRDSELNETWFRDLVARRANLGGDKLDLVVEGFVRVWCDGSNALSRNVINSDRQELGQRVRIAREWADETVAHLNEGGEVKKLTWGELNRSFDTIAEVLNRYNGLFKGTEYVFPPSLPLHWQEPFERVLFASENEV